MCRAQSAYAGVSIIVQGMAHMPGTRRAVRTRHASFSCMGHLIMVLALSSAICPLSLQVL